MKAKIEQSALDGTWYANVTVGRRIIFTTVEHATMADAAWAVGNWEAEQRAIGERIIAKLARQETR